MGRETRKKIDVARPAAPLSHNPFAALAELEALQNLPPAPATPAGPTSVEPPLKPVGTETAPPGPRKTRGRLILRREKKDRGGKVVVVVSGFNEVRGASAVMIGDLAKELKGKLGCGGTFDRQEIVLQGDRAAQVAAMLEQLGFAVRGITS
jgi:translation initiation factor 1